MDMYYVYKGLKRCRKGQGIIEYAFILGFVAVGAIVALTTVGGQVASFYNSLGGWFHVT